MNKIEELIEILRLSKYSVEEKRQAVIEIGYLGDKKAVPWLINIIDDEDCNSWDLKNAAAISLGDLHANEAVPYLMKAIRNPKFKGKIGTYLFALSIGPLDCKSYFLDFVRLICDPSLEVRSSADTLFEYFVSEVDYETLRQGLKILRENKILNNQIKNIEKFGAIGFIEHAEELINNTIMRQ